jgi:benzoylformate decarboxylase
MSTTVRDAAFDVFRDEGLTPLFANPGSTEISLLTDLPGDLPFVLGLHEGSVVGMATGYALGRGAPALAILHTTPGLGNAVSALATSRVNRAPLVVVVGQQDRRHLATEPFLAGRLLGLAGDYPVWVDQPVRAPDVPGAIERARHEAMTGRGPAIVIVPMDDWEAEAPPATERAAPRRVVRAAAADAAAVGELVAFLAGAASPALVVGSDADDPETWAALVTLTDRIGCPVFQEAFGARAGFPHDHPRFAGHLPADRPRLRALLAPYDALLLVGAPAFRQYPFDAGGFVEEGTAVAVLAQEPAEAHRSTAALTVLAPVAAACRELAALVPARTAPAGPPPAYPPEPPPRVAAGETLRAGHVFAALAERLARDAIVIEESPSNRPELLLRLPAREPLGILSPAMGGLGFAMPAAVGLRMARRDRPVVAVVGDGSSLYAIQSVWSAAQYGVGALFVVLANGGYAIMNRLAELHGGTPPWPGFAVDVAAVARGFGCPARTVRGADELGEALDEILPGLAGRDEPLLLQVEIAQDETFAP